MIFDGGSQVCEEKSGEGKREEEKGLARDKCKIWESGKYLMDCESWLWKQLGLHDTLQKEKRESVEMG